MQSVLYSGFRFHHHNPTSGYDVLASDQCDYVCGDKLPFGHYPETSFARRFNFFLVDLVTLFRGLNHSTVHYFYPENTAYFSPVILKWLGKKIVFTIHLSETTWIEPTRSVFRALKQRCLRSVDVIITLSSAHHRVFQSHFPSKTTRFIPHGFGFSRDEPSQAIFDARLRDKKIIVVGQNYRDFDLLERIVASRGNRRAEFHLVGAPENLRPRFESHASVVWHHRMDQVDYERLLESGVVMLLPLKFATANNAILEAYNCYLPVIATEVDGVVDYAIERDLLIGDAEKFWHCFDRVCDLTPAGYRERCVATHDVAKARFAWPTVRMALASVY